MIFGWSEAAVYNLKWHPGANRLLYLRCCDSKRLLRSRRIPKKNPLIPADELPTHACRGAQNPRSMCLLCAPKFDRAWSIYCSGYQNVIPGDLRPPGITFDAPKHDNLLVCPMYYRRAIECVFFCHFEVMWKHCAVHCIAYVSCMQQ